VTSISETDGDLGRKLVANMENMTWDRNGSKSFDNAKRNSAHIGQHQSIAALRGQQMGDGDSAIVIAAGPSIKRRDPIPKITAAGYNGAIIAADSGIAYCLRNGVVPDLAVSLDPDATRIVRWFGDPNLSSDSISADDYFRRQDMDTAFADELRTNDEIMELLNRHAKDMRIALCTSASESVVNRVLELGMEVFWWNPMLDDPDEPDSVTLQLQAMNGLPCLNAGGNVGTACWAIADVVLGKSAVALTGVDFAYYADTPYSSTQYYPETVALVGEDNLDAVYMHLHNPHIDAWFYTDPAYMWYREAFLDMSKYADCVTYNCTEGGILFGDSIQFTPLAEFLAKQADTAPSQS
jgi:hypothetical protein